MRFFLFVFLVMCILQDANPIYLKQIGTKDGLSQISVMSIYQDELGRIWFGTFEGVSMYDGEHVTAFKHSEGNSLADAVPVGNESFPIVGDGQGNIFFHSDGNLIHYDLKTERFSCLKTGRVSTVFCNDSAILVAVADTVYSLDVKSKTFTTVIKTNFRGLIQKLFIDSKRQLWIGHSSGLYLMTGKDSLVCMIGGNEDIYEIMEDSRQNLWIATRNNGLFKLDPHGITTKFKHKHDDPNSIPHDHVRSFAEDNSGNIWTGTFAGLCKFDPATESYTVYKKDDLPGSLNHSSVFSTFKDRQGTIWAGTYYGGVHYFNPETDCFTHYSSNPKRDDCLSHFFVGRMVEDRDSNIYICTEGGGLNFFDRRTKRFKHFLADGNPRSIAHNNLKNLAYSSKYNRLYIGTHTGGVSVYDIDRDVFHNFRDEFPDYHNSTGDIIDQMQIFRDDTLIILGRKGFCKLDMATGRLLPIFDGISNQTTFLIDSKDRLWSANNSILTLIDMNAPEERAVYNYGKKGLGQFGVSCIAEDEDGRIFFGTSGSGLYQYVEEADSFRAFTAEKNLLLSNYCYDIALSKEKNELIVSGDKGLSFLNVDRRELRMIDLNSLIFSGLTFGNKMLVCGDGEIFVGGIGGMTSFFAGDALGINRDYSIYFSSLEVNGNRISPSDGTHILERAMPFTDRIKLGYKQNNINISFASNDYTNPHNSDMYEYKLEGFDNNWTQGDNIVYTNIRPGSYRLTVRENAMNADAVPKFLQMDIRIGHPWYANPLAYAFYLTVAAVIIWAFLRLSKARMRLRNSLEMERKEKENIEKLNQSKLQFFSNISHEFNTPLTLISVQMERLLNKNVSPVIYSKLLKINKNVIHLRNLIGELLDFRKLERGHVKLKVRELDLIPFLKEIYFYFYELSAGRRMTYRFEAPESAPVLLWFDPRQMQKVFHNLISNAFKCTAENGMIEISVSQDNDSVKIKVIDNGVGIETDDIHRIFERFYQVDGSKQNFMNAPGTGIGLSTVKAIMDLHHGIVTVESKPGYGSIFIITLLKGNSHFGDEEIVRTTDVEYVKTAGNEHLQELKIENGELRMGERSVCDEDEGLLPADGRKNTALIVEDNEELLLVLRDILGTMYRVLTANDGREGLSIARREKPDLVISDVMMPGMSGTELCMAIKNDFDTCHIPVILLTALSSVEQNIYGLQHGADDYIAKPFVVENLVARCNNLVRNRTIIKNKFGSNAAGFDIQSVSTNPIDQNFIDRTNGIVEKNMSNPDFNVAILASELNLSRSSLYSKFESLTGMTPNDYVMLRRLKKAADMLRNNRNANISEVSDYFCFGSPRYFSHCFKKQFGVSPAEWRKSGRIEN